MEEGPCGSFRFAVKPHVKVGVITLQRKRPWPSCPNPDTGNQWSDDMKVEIQQTLQKTPFEVIYAPEDIQVVDDPSLRKALGKYNQLWMNRKSASHSLRNKITEAHQE